MILSKLDEAFLVNISKFMVYHQMNKYEECVYLVLNDLSIRSFWLQHIKYPAYNEIHSLTICYLNVKISICLKNIKKRVVSFNHSFLRKKWVKWICSFDVIDVLRYHILFVIFVKAATESIIFIIIIKIICILYTIRYIWLVWSSLYILDTLSFIQLIILHNSRVLIFKLLISCWFIAIR